MANGTQTNGLIGMFSKPIMQLGFAGLCVILIGMICWMISNNEARVDKILEMQQSTNQVIAANNQAMQANTSAIKSLQALVTSQANR